MPRSGPQAIGDVMAQLMHKRGYARQWAAQHASDAWREAVGESDARQTQVTGFRGGKMEILVAHSTLLQELTFRKIELVRRLRELLPDHKITDIRFRVGPVQDPARDA